MDKGIEALIARKGNAVTGNYYLAECGNCSEMFPSERMTGGEALYAGDYGDCYCPHCGAADCDISDYGDILSNAGLAWNYQQKHIDALIAALEQAQQEYQTIEQKLINAAVYIETLESEPRKTNLKLLNEIAGLKRKCVELPDSFATIGENLRTQANRITDQPMFVVFEKREIIGSDEHSPSRVVWCWEGEEVSELRAKRLETLYQECRDTRGYDRYAMQEIDVFVTACFTEQGCRDYLIRNGHNLRFPYIFASGSYRNSEYQQVRSWLMTIGTVEGGE